LDQVPQKSLRQEISPESGPAKWIFFAYLFNFWRNRQSIVKIDFDSDHLWIWKSCIPGGYYRLWVFCVLSCTVLKN
jgi:hypothetical protein